MAPPRWLYKPVGSNDRQVTRAERGHVLHHSGVWSPDSTWIVYDTRGDAAGDVFDGAEIQAVNARTREVRTLFTASNGAKCGMASFNPVPHKREIVFTLGPENPTGAWTYAPHRRRGALADCSTALKFRQKPGDRHGDVRRANDRPNLSPSSNEGGEGETNKRTNENAPTQTRTREKDARILDARDLLPDADGAFTPGALRGGTAAHAFSPDGLLVSAAYEDAVLLRNANLSEYADASPPVERAFRSIAIVAMDGKGGVAVDTSEHPRNHSGEGFAVVATRHVGDAGAARADDAGAAAAAARLVARAGDECWVGRRGYRRSAASGGGWQGRALAFLGEVDTDPDGGDDEGRALASSESGTGRRGKGGTRTRAKKAGRGGKHLELFVLDLPVDPAALRVASSPAAPLAGTATTRPRPPFGVAQRRVTRTDARAYPGLTAGAPSAESSAAAAAASVPDPGVATKGNSVGKMARAAGPGAGAGVGPRFWPRTSPDGSRACVCALDDDGVPQLYLVRLGDDRETTALMPVTRLAPPGVQSCFSWSPDGSAIAFAHDGSVCVVRAPKGDESKPATRRDVERAARRARRNPPTRLTRRRFGKEVPRPESVSFSPCGGYVSYVRRVIRKGMRAPKLTGKPFEDEGDDVDGDGIDDWFNQVCVVKFEYRLRQPFRSVKKFVSGIVAGAAAVAAAAAARHAGEALLAAARRRALARLRARAGRALEPAPRPAPREAWQTFAKDVEASKTNLKAAPRASPKDAWASFAADERRA